MSKVRREIGSQPAVWANSLVAERSQHLPGRDAWVGVIGCGTSFYTAQSYASYRESNGFGRTDAFPASLVPPREWDCLIAISRSGTTTEVLDALSRARATKRLAVTASSDGPLASAVDDVLALPFADEESVVQTRFATTALLTLLLSVGYNTEDSVHDAAVGAGFDLESSVWHGARQFVFVGAGWTFGVANEAALKLREMAGQWSEESRQELEKEALAVAVAAYVSENMRVGLSGGTTLTRIGRTLGPGPPINVLTNSLSVASELAQWSQHTLVTSGGLVRDRSYEMVGPVADRTIATFNLDLCVIGADGVSESGVSTHDHAEAATNRALVEAASQCIVAVDHTKLGKTMFSQICGLEDVQTLLTTGDPPADLATALDRHNVKLVLADPSTAVQSTAVPA